MLDLFMATLIIWALISGWRNGFLRELLSTAGYLVGLLVAALAYKWLGSYLAVEGSQANMMTSIVAFLLLWVATPIVLGLVANLLTGAVKALQLGWINSALGSVVSLIKFSILIGCILSVLSALGLLHADRTRGSVLYAPLSSGFSAVTHTLLGSEDTPAADSSDSTHDASTAADTTWVDVRKH
ncbi:MAG: CvpA family protein [Alloprevotella sp.]